MASQDLDTVTPVASTLLELSLLFCISLGSLFVLRKIAKKISLVDKPNERKLHHGDIPLVGGISICSTLVYFLLTHHSLIPNSTIYIGCIISLVFVGALDDKYDISYKIRFFIQALLSLIMMVHAGIELLELGNLFGSGTVTLGPLGYIITVLAVIGAINAFNMIDGIDGLLGGISIVAFGGLGIMLFHDGQINLSYLCLGILVIILPYLLLNLGILGKKYKVFMGDAGSMLIGFSLIWLLLLSSQNGTNPPLRPVTALWLIAIPLMDMVSLMIRRMRKGHSPFKPDREHLHHIFQRIGFTSSQTVIIITVLATLLATYGILGEMLDISEAWMFYSFILCFILYFVVISYVWKITALINRVLARKS